jgi:transposase
MTTATPIRMTEETTDQPALCLAFALGAKQGQLGCTTGAAQRPRERNGLARQSAAVREESRQAKERLGLPAAAPVRSCAEAGRDGCWLPGWLVPQGGANGVVDASSMAVHRRHRRAQTARLDGPQGLARLLGHAAGARKGWRIVRGPRGEEEDRRQLQRAFTTAQRDWTRGIKRIKGRRAAHGRVRPPGGDGAPPLAPLRLWDGPPLPAGLQHRRGPEWEQVVAWTPRLAP